MAYDAKRFSNWELVYYYFTKWKNNGVIEQIHELLRDKYAKKQEDMNHPVWLALTASQLKQTDWVANIADLMVAK